MRQKSIKWNALLNIIRMSLSVVFPLITFPYASRILGAETLGTVNYTLSVVNYASLIAALGISTYAIREGAKIRENYSAINQFAQEVFTINIITTIISYWILGIVISVLPELHVYWKLIFLQSMSILFTTLSVEWINVVYEDYLFVTIRALLTNIVTTLLLFLLVHHPSDYYIYASLTVVSHAVVSVMNYFHCKKYIHIKITGKPCFRKHMKPVLIFFANSLAVSLYVNSDSTMLGWMIGSYSVGLYTASVKVYSMVKTVLAAMYGVTISRMTFYITNDKMDQYYNLCQNVISGLMVILLPGICALFLFAEDIIFLLSGMSYMDSVVTLRILSIGLLFAILGGFLTSCINIPNGMEKNNLYAASVSALINILFNLLMIPQYHQNGAAFTTVIAEAIVCVYCIICARDIVKQIRFRNIRRYIFDGVTGIMIVITSYFITKSITSSITFHLLLNVFVITGVYIIYLVIRRNIIVISFMDGIKKKLWVTKRRDT